MTQSKVMKNQITEGVIWKQLLVFCFPIILGTLFQQMYNAADVIVVGHFVGKEALACVGGSSGTVINLVVGFFVGLSSGATVIVSRAYGAGKTAELDKAVHASMALSVAGSVILMAAGFIWTPKILGMMDTPQRMGMPGAGCPGFGRAQRPVHDLRQIPSLSVHGGCGCDKQRDGSAAGDRPVLCAGCFL